jgi:hypothetical protein
MNNTEIRNFLLTNPTVAEMRSTLKALGYEVTFKRCHKTFSITKEQCSILLLDLI